MTASIYKKVTNDGLWTNNAALVQLLGLCPLLAVTGSVVNGLGLGLATIAVLVGSNSIVSLIRNHVTDAVRLPAFVMIIAALTTCIELVMKAFTYELYEVLGIFIPLIVTNCSILGRADAFASKNKLLPSLLDGLMMGIGFTLVLIVLGAFREMLGQGTLFSDMHLLFGANAENLKLTLVDDYNGLLVAILPPGAFLGMGILIAIKNVIDQQIKDRAARRAHGITVGSKRVRTTGNVS